MVRIFDVGRICVKIAGREAGKKCVIVDIIDDKYVLITGPKPVTGVKRRRANIKHLEPTEHKINISKGASDEEVSKALIEAGLINEMRKQVRISLS
ncbi:MAG: 50S ribosomal protein L14e [Thermoprotei archaeon]|nr:MAG: 50S ribosomal protein L14e [Thermofilum sp. ex4484_79]RLE61842.1 MAG: 50S ribosomal protein L14e [Thermoprotei archaeon]HDD64168.1 50S ribosomal protein L14e [Thermoprotei archaeon]